MGKIFYALKFGTRLVRAKVQGRYIPLQVQFSVTDRCNLRCSYCYASYPQRGLRELAYPEIIKIIDDLVSLGTLRINLVGGEPLLREDIGQIVDYIKSKGIECAMTSNGFLVPEKIDAVKKLDLLCVSLDGDQDANDRNRGEGAYQAAMAAIETARKNKIPFQVAAVITKDNLKSLDNLLVEARNNKFMVGFATLINKTQDGQRKAPQNIPTDQEYKQALAQIIALKQKGYPVLFSFKTLDYCRKWPLAYSQDKIIGETPGFPYIKCFAGKYFAIIDTNADIYPCPSLVGLIKPLNCLEVGVKKAFASLNNHPCKTCHIPCQNEFNLLYALNPFVLLNILQNYKGNKR